MHDIPDETVDAIVTDPPYGIGFMGAAWDSFGSSTGKQTVAERQSAAKVYADENKGAPRYGNSHGHAPKLEEMRKFQSSMALVFEEALRISKPGAYLLCFGGTRTFHRMACAIEDAGWVVKDCIMWVYGTGMPHGQNIGKMMQKKGMDDAAEWLGWNTQLKPAWEPIIVAQKPVRGTIVDNVTEYGVGAMNIDDCRVPTDNESLGRYPANIIHDGSDEVVSLFPQSKGQLGSITGNEKSRTGQHGIYGEYKNARTPSKPRNDEGSAARFFYNTRLGEKSAEKRYTENGSTNFAFKPGERREPESTPARFFYCAKASRKERGENNSHPTCKPLALMEYLIKLVTQKGAIVLDPFAGSGTTLLACENTGRRSIGIEREFEYVDIIKERLEG